MMLHPRERLPYWKPCHHCGSSNTELEVYNRFTVEIHCLICSRTQVIPTESANNIFDSVLYKRR